MGEATPWREHCDEYASGAGGFHERHYNEFVTFLPYVQRFLYGEGRAQRRSATASWPMMAYLALDEPQRLTRSDFIRLGLVTGGGDTAPGSQAALPYGEQHLADFERHFCYDRFWAHTGAAPHTRYLCSGLALVAVGDATSEFYRCSDRGVLAQFRHQHFLLFLIAHFQKATLLMYSDQLAEALTALDVTRPQSVKRFKRLIRMSYVGFLGFTHRYWFHEVSEQSHVKALFHMTTQHLQIDGVYEEVKERIRDMNGYLAADAPLWQRVGMFFAIFVPVIGLTMYTMVKSKRLSDFLDVVSDERRSVWAKSRAFFAVWGPSARS